MKDYTQAEINEIILSKNFDEFYMATLENRDVPLTDEEMDSIKKGKVTYINGTDLEKKIFEKSISSDSKFIQNLLKKVLGGNVRQCAVITMIGDQIYDVVNFRFINPQTKKIIHFDNITNYYNQRIARFRIFTPEESSMLEEDTVALDVDDGLEYRFTMYEDDHFMQEENEDLTNAFISEAKAMVRKLVK